MQEKELIKQIKQLKNIQPDKKWVVFCREELKREIGASQQSWALVLNLARLFQPFYRPAFAVIAGLLVFVVGGSAVVVASKNSLPGDKLYPIKITIEKAEIKLMADETAKAQKQAEIAGRRAQELSAIISQSSNGKAEKVRKAVEQIDRQLTRTQSSLPKLNAIQKENAEKITEAAMAVQESTLKVEGALAQISKDLPEISENQTLATKISDISVKISETNSQAIEIIESIESMSGNTSKIDSDIPETQTTTPESVPEND